MCVYVDALMDQDVTLWPGEVVIPQNQQCFLWKLVVLQAPAVGCLLHPNNAIPLIPLHLQEVCELHRLHLMKKHVK